MSRPIIWTWRPGSGWLNWLIRHGATCVVVSHDRAFPNQVTTRTLTIERGAVRAYAGNYDFSLEEREAGDRQWGEYEAQQRRIAAAERAAEKRTGRILRERERLGALLGEIPVSGGNVHWCSGARVGYYAQEHEQLDGNGTPLEVVMEVCPHETAARTMLACLALRQYPGAVVFVSHDRWVRLKLSHVVRQLSGIG